MFEATKVHGLFEIVPEQLRGVFWMKGDYFAQELIVMQFGRCFKEEMTLAMPQAPFNWGFAGGKPKDAPFGGRDYYEGSGAEGALWAGSSPNTVSWKFGECPPFAEYCHDTLGNMSFANVQLHPLGDASTTIPFGEIVGSSSQLPSGTLDGVMTLEASATAPGDEWARPTHYAKAGKDCLESEFGQASLVRLLDGEGKPVGDNLKAFEEYMVDSDGVPVDIILWTGFKSEEARQEEQARMRALVGE